jgi:hypothetical protein
MKHPGNRAFRVNDFYNCASQSHPKTPNLLKIKRSLSVARIVRRVPLAPKPVN